MARPGLEKSEVKKARELLLSQGRHPSVDAVRIALGNTGSKSTIHKYLKELDQDAGNTSDRQRKATRELHDLVDELAAKLHAQADGRVDQRMDEIRAEYETALRRNAEEMAVMQKQIDLLNYQLQQALARNMEPAQDYSEDMRNSSIPPGFGMGNLDDNNRNGKEGWSHFNLLFNSRSSNHVDIHVGQAGYEILARI